MPAGCPIASCRPLIAPPSRCLVRAGCCICLSPSSHCAAFSSSCLASWLSPCLSPSSCCATLSSTHHASLLLRRPSSSSHCARRRPLVLSSCRLVVTLPLNAPPSCCLVVSLCRLSLSCRASWLSRHHLLSSSRCTAGAGNGGRTSESDSKVIFMGHEIVKLL